MEKIDKVKESAHLNWQGVRVLAIVPILAAVVYMMRIAAGLFVGSAIIRDYYIESDFNADLTWLLVSGGAACLLWFMSTRKTS